MAEHNVFVAAESLDKAAAERDELTKKLEALEKGSQEALEQLQAEAEEREKKIRLETTKREERLESRLRTLTMALSGTVLILAPSHLSLILIC